MADSIVACPSCGKKYKVKEGSKPGQFQCTSCGASVPYGGAPAAAPAKAVPARPAAKARPAPGGRGGPRRPARSRGAAPARAAPRGGRGRARRGGGQADEEGPPPKSNTTLYVVIAVAAVVVVGGVAAFLLTSKSPEPYVPPTTTAGQPGGAGTPAAGGPGATPSGGSASSQPTPADEVPTIKPPTPEPEPEPEPEPAREPEPEPAEPPKPGDYYGRTKMDLRTVDYELLVKDLEHYEETPADQRAEIDKLCATLVDYNAGRDQLDAQTKLMQIGRPAVPKVLSAFTRTGDISGHEGMVNTVIVQDTLIGIVGNPWKLSQLKQFQRPNVNDIKRVVRWWFVWWYAEGYKAKEFKPPEEDEEEDEE